MSKRPGRRLRKKPAPQRVRVTVESLVRSMARRLRQARVVVAHGTTDPVAEAAFLVGETLGQSPAQMDAKPDAVVSSKEASAVRALVERRIKTRKPAAYLVNAMILRGLRFYVDERVIVPRSYLAEIFDEPLFAGEKFSLVPKPENVNDILELCTGSGCLAVLAARRFPKAQIDAVDLSSDALDVAKRNVRGNRRQKRITLLHGDLFAPVAGRRYDLIIANPPYVDAKGMASLPPECRHEPAVAFDGGKDGLDLVRKIVAQAGRHLKPGGGLLCEIGRGRRSLERAYPDKKFLWLDTEESTGEVFWLGADQLD